MIRKVNEFFFPIEEDETVNVSDGIWFYGTIGFIALIGVIILL